jgi:glycosyltransferase involved in cell wall biosynthesis
MQALGGDTKKSLSEVGHADVLVGIPSYNSASTIGNVIAQSAAGMSQYLADRRNLIFISDGGSTDETVQMAKSVQLAGGIQLVAGRYQGIAGKGSAVKAIFEAVLDVGATSVVMLDSDLRSVTPSWIELLARPVLDGAGLITPRYARHKYDGTITNQLCFPLTQALYGKRVRQPIGGDFGLSGRLVRTLLESPLWDTQFVPRFGIDIFITSSALAQGFKVEEADLGAKIHESKDPALQLASMFREVVGSALVCMRQYERSWRPIRGSSPVRLHKNEIVKAEPPAVSVNLDRLIRESRAVYSEARYFKSALPTELRRTLDSTMSGAQSESDIPVDVWAQTIYQISSKFKTSTENEISMLLEGLRGVWEARVAAFVRDTAQMTNEEAERKVEEEAKLFEATKGQLLEIYGEG